MMKNEGPLPTSAYPCRYIHLYQITKFRHILNYTSIHNIYIYIYIYPGSRFPSPPPQWYGPPGPWRGGGVRAFTTISTIATTIITPTTPRAPPTTTTNAAATTDYCCCCCCCCCCGYCCCYYCDYYYILLYTMSIFTSTSTSTSTFKPNYVCTHACPHHRPQGGGRIPWRGGEGGTSEAWLIYTRFA